MPSLRALIFGVSSQQPAIFRVQDERIDAATVQEVLLQLSKRLGVEFHQDTTCIGLTQFHGEPFRIFENGESRGFVGIYIERDGRRHFPRWGQDFVILENDVVVVSTMA